MEWGRSRAQVARFEFLEQATSTNDVLREAASGPEAADWPHGAAVVTDDQTAGRGRLGRTWLAPTGKTLAISVLLRPERYDGRPLDAAALGWLPLIAGLAMTEAVDRAVAASDRLRVATDAPEVPHRADAPRRPDASKRPAGSKRADASPESDDDGPGLVEVELKWPNDVLISGYKVCGILTELLPGAEAVVVGAGLNLTLDEHDLPTLTSTSLLLATGRRPDADAVLADYLATLLAAVETLVAADGDATASGLADRIAERCGTIGAEVRVELPGGAELLGTAERLDRDGRLVVRDRESGEPQAVAAGDVTHLRY
ncbi:biotin--[acetyl-CoA-carboxylase] ligase [Agromyces intestinalis]|uniref:biotin--[biotin carboxyl-carrier protein] ligase n=1 Tax=Agromyces intestinalis TaxID=2592652 RepID=A0A5C1YBW3_9MICO|nr:biotin--[acetyl-CoA-carboxylase] ligase [Agromyces intestinalis]QEO13573.1 biotin--[acetyl-CoA-carboxylase] ligase [Agromyces intestinalis]